MRVAIIDPSLFTWPYDSELAAGLAANGHDVQIFGKVLGPGETAGPRLRQLFYPRLARPWAQRLPRPAFLAAKGIGHILSMRHLVAALEEWRPDVIHMQWTPLPAVDKRFLPALRRIAPLVLTVHDSQPFNNAPVPRVQTMGMMEIIRAFEQVIVHTERARNRLVQHGVSENRITIIPHGLLHDGPAPADAAEAPVRMPDDPVEILQFGKIKPYKGVDLLIEAVARMPERARSRCRIRVVGKSYIPTEGLVARARELGVYDRFTFDFRFVEEAEMLGLFRRADLLVFPYREIDASGVLMTALSVGRPIVASRLGCFEEMLEEGRHALLVPSGDVDELAASLFRMVEDDELREYLGEGVRALRRSIPSWADIGRLTEKVYRRMGPAEVTSRNDDLLLDLDSQAERD
ncbi:glycosyltransferase [Telmatospirillum sp. J64-1]|uniref:glycosyltransferase n=1 Tax=Telmatospirillum sp. J64-1 TaxID=2502183 RepID=UPI00115EAC0B|nr:glycosyltransferase [Telmatospirillum sp. J64-1]